MLQQGYKSLQWQIIDKENSMKAEILKDKKNSVLIKLTYTTVEIVEYFPPNLGEGFTGEYLESVAYIKNDNNHAAKLDAIKNKLNRAR